MSVVCPFPGWRVVVPLHHHTMQSGIKRIYAPQKADSAIGGICRWWYVPVQGIATMPRIDAASQQYLAEPQLLPGYQWLGPIRVPDGKLGYTESQEGARPGPWAKQQVAAYTPGDTPSNRILRQNMMRGEYVVVAKLRSSHLYLVLGTKESGFSFDHSFATGKGGNGANTGADWVLSGEAPYIASFLSFFSQDLQALAGLPNQVFFGSLPAGSINRLPTTAEIESAASMVFTTGGNTRGNWLGDITPLIRFVAELISEPVKTRYYQNQFSFGAIGLPGGTEAWINKGLVLRTAGGLYRVYVTGFPTAFPLQLLDFII